MKECILKANSRYSKYALFRLHYDKPSIGTGLVMSVNADVVHVNLVLSLSSPDIF